jgi:hypothetical protein
MYLNPKLHWLHHHHHNKMQTILLPIPLPPPILLLLPHVYWPLQSPILGLIFWRLPLSKTKFVLSTVESFLQNTPQFQVIPSVQVSIDSVRYIHKRVSFSNLNFFDFSPLKIYQFTLSTNTNIHQWWHSIPNWSKIDLKIGCWILKTECGKKVFDIKGTVNFVWDIFCFSQS